MLQDSLGYDFGQLLFIYFSYENFSSLQGSLCHVDGAVAQHCRRHYAWLF